MQAVFRALLEGNERHASQDGSRFDDLQDGKRPDAVTVCCADSRVLQDDMWDNDEPGRLFTVSNIGNRVRQQTAEGEVVSGDVLYPMVHTGTDLAIVVGHTGCGAIRAAHGALLDGLSEPRGITHSLDRLTPHLEAGVELLPEDLGRQGAVNRLVEYNVDRQVEHLLTSPDVPDDLTVIGAVYDFQDVYSENRGRVHVINIDGQTAVDTLQAAHPDIASRISRLWE